MTSDNHLNLRAEAERVALEQEAEKVARRLREDGVWVSYNLRVEPRTAAYMLNITEETLRNRRYMGKPPEPVYGANGKPTYPLVRILVELGLDEAA